MRPPGGTTLSGGNGNLFHAIIARFPYLLPGSRPFPGSAKKTSHLLVRVSLPCMMTTIQVLATFDLLAFLCNLSWMELLAYVALRLADASNIMHGLTMHARISTTQEA